MWLQSLLDFLKAIWPTLVGATKLILAGMVARQITQGNAAENELEAVERANHAAARNVARPVDERLHDAKQRGLYRVSSKPSEH